MKIRAQLAGLAVAVIAIPVLLLTLIGLLWTLTHNPAALPNYEELPRGAELLTDARTWDQVRATLASRPPKAEVYVFDPSFRLIYGTASLGPLHRSGDTLTLQEAVKFVQNSDVPRDMFLFRPAGTQVWIVQVQPSAPPMSLVTQRVLLGLGIFLLVVLVLSVALAVFMGRALAKTVIQLEQAARQIARGDLASPVPPIRGAQEVRSMGQALETMRQSLLAEEARKARFVMGVSHDLKTPLALIKGYVELIKDGPPASEKAREARFDLILDKADQLDGMIDHLIDYSKVNTEDWQRTWSPLALAPFLEDFGRSLAPDAQLLHRNLEWQIDLPAGTEVACDARSIRRCLENLVHNALRYTHDGGTVGLRAVRTDGAIEIVVWDNGPGLDAEDLPHLFDAFYRGTHSRREVGMGLGLSIVKSILDSHGWTIRAESDQGARFVITIPCG